MDTGKISLGKLLALLIFMVGIQSAWADVWDGTTKTPAKKQTIDGKEYFLIESAANLAWFSDTVNIYAAKEIAKAYSADSLARANMTAADTAKANAYAQSVKQAFIDTAATDKLKDSTNKYNSARNNYLDSIAKIFKDGAAESIAANVDVFFKSNSNAITLISEKTKDKNYASPHVKFNAKVVADYIDMNHKPFVPIAAGKGEILYGGIFDGNHVTIKNLYVSSDYISEINSNYGQNVAFVAALHEGVVKNVVLDSVSIIATVDIGTILKGDKNKISVGTIVAWQKSGTVEGCYASGILYNSGKGQAVGGVVGNADAGLIKDNLSVVSIQIAGSEAYVGGVIGQAKDKVNIESCVFDGGKFINDLTAHDGGVVGLRYEGNTTLFKNTYYDQNDVGQGVAQGSTNGIYAVAFLNEEHIACVLNEGEWNNADSTCSGEGVWSTGDHITNQGVSKNDKNETIYTITFNANGGTFAAGAKTEKYLRFGELATPDEISIPTNEFKKFEGWSLSPTATKKDDDLGYVYSPKTVYAVWTDVPTYTITFDFNTGSDATKLTKVVVKGDSITLHGFSADQLPSTYKANGITYNFMGWAKTENGTVLDENQYGIATKDETFYARWKNDQQTYQVTYMTGLDAVYSVELVEEGDYAKGPAVNPSKDGYTFAGWYTEDDSLYNLNDKNPLKQHIVLYAKWSPVRYDIVYNLSDGWTNSANNPRYYTVEDNVLFKAPKYKNDSLEFDSWFYDGTFTNKAEQIAPGSRTGNLSLYYKWNVRTYTIWLSAGVDGYNIVEPVIKRYGEPITLPGASFEYPGYEQKGWATTDGGAKVYELLGTYTDNAEVELFPYWEKATYKITYELDGGVNHVDNDTTYTMDSSDVVLKNPTKVGYKFEGWYDAEVGGKKVTKVEIKAPYGDVKLYAKWSQTKVTVTLQDNSCEYNGKNCGAKYTVSVTNGSLGSDYKTVIVTDSIKNVFDGPIDANIVSFAIVNKTTGEVVTDQFDVHYEGSSMLAVTPRDVSFAGKNETTTYTGDEIHVVSAANASGLPTGLNHTHNVGYEITATDAGDYPAVMTDPADVKIWDEDGNDVTANYNVVSITPPSTGLTIKPTSEPFTISMADEYVPVGGSIKGTPTSTASSGTTTFFYRIGDSGEWKENLGELALPATPDEYVIINIKATNPNYTKEAKTSTKITVTTKTILTVVAASDSKVYDGTALVNATYTCPECATKLSSGGELSVTMNDASITNVGSVTNTVKTVEIFKGGSDVTDNYAINMVAGTLTVTKAPLTITTASDSKAYDGNPLTAGVTAVFVNGETATVVATGSQKMVGSSKNTYDIDWVTATAKQGNYQIVENLGTLTVSKAAVTIKVNAAEKLYGDADPEFSGVVTGLVNPDDLGVIKYYRSNANVKNAGSYPKAISASYTANMNYEVNVTKGNLTVKKRNVTLTSADASKVYDGTALTAPTVTVGGDGFAPNEGVYFTVTGSQTDAGTSANTFTYELKEGTDVSTNYTLAEVKGDLTVTKSPVTVSIVGRTGTYAYNGSQQVVSGYDASINNAMYSASDIVFGGESVIQKTKSGTYAMGLASAMFTNKNNNFDVTFNVTDGSLTITPPEIVVAYNDAGDTLHVIVGDDDSDSLINEKINEALAGHVPPIALPTKDEDKDSTYAFDGWEKNPTSGQYEPVFDATVKKDTIDAKYQDDPEKHIDVEIHVTDVHKDIVEKINAALEQNGIALPSKPDNGDSTYVLDWKQNPETGVYEPDFKGVLRVEQIIVKYGDGATDTIYVDIRAQDSKSQIEQKINDALNNHLPPIKVKGKDDTYTLAGWEKDEATGYYVPVFAKGDVVYVINFHLPEGAVLTSKFNGYNYGEVTLLPDAVMKSDTTWVFNGWYTKTKGRGDRVKAMRETDAGNKSLYPLFQKTLRYEIAGKTGEVVVIYTDRADTTIARALKSVIPDEISKNGVRYAFVKWKLEDGVYKAVLKSLAVRFNVAVDARALNIEEAQMGSRYAVFDMDGRVVKRGTVSNGSQRVEIPKSGSYMVRVGKDAVQVNVK